MKIKNENKIKEKIIQKLLGLVYRLDNSGNSFFDKNGELFFVDLFVDEEKNNNPVIFDIGANIGEYSELLVKKLNNKSYSLHIFEPQKNCFVDLLKKFKDNKNIFLNNFGISDDDKTATIYKNEDKSGLTSLYKRNIDFYNMKMNVQEEIHLKRADSYIRSKNVKHINLLKIDVEGHEITALSSLGEFLNGDFIDYIQFEYGGANLDSHTNLLDFYNLLESRGFKIAKIMPKYLELRDYNPRFDNFVYANFVAVSKKLITRS